MPKGPFSEVKQVCLSGKTLLMFNYDVKDREIGESALIREILIDHYKSKPPIGYFSKDQKQK